MQANSLDVFYFTALCNKKQCHNDLFIAFEIHIPLSLAIELIHSLAKYDWYRMPNADEVNHTREHHQVEKPKRPRNTDVVNT